MTDPTALELQPHPYAPAVFIVSGSMEDGCRVCGYPFRLHNAYFRGNPHYIVRAPASPSEVSNGK